MRRHPFAISRQGWIGNIKQVVSNINIKIGLNRALCQLNEIRNPNYLILYALIILCLFQISNNSRVLKMGKPVKFNNQILRLASIVRANFAILNIPCFRQSFVMHPIVNVRKYHTKILVQPGSMQSCYRIESSLPRIVGILPKISPFDLRPYNRFLAWQ